MKLLAPRLAVSIAVLAGCSAAKTTPTAPAAPTAPPSASATAAAPPLEKPPPAGITPLIAFPPVAHAELANGLEVRTVSRRSYPVIDVRLVVRSGQSSDGAHTGIAVLTGELLKDGGAGRFTSRELAERAATLGGALRVLTDRDSTQIAITVTAGDLEPALELVSTVATKPRFSPAEFQKLRTREVDRVKGRSRTSPAWLASMVLYRELFSLPVGVHPYARYDGLPDEIAEITLGDAKAWARAHVVPENSALVVTGDVDAKAVEAAAERFFGAWRGKRPAPPSFSSPQGPNALELYVVDRPGSAQSHVLVGMLGPERKSPEYPALMAANQVLGGGVAGRLFLDVREKLSLAYRTGSSVEEVLHGPMPLVLFAGTETTKTADTVRALLANLELMKNAPPSGAELDRAARFLSDSFLFRMETAGALASLAAGLFVLGLDDDAYDEYRKSVRELTPEATHSVARRAYGRSAPVVVVAGDAASVKDALAGIATVKVVDPGNFSVRESVARQ